MINYLKDIKKETLIGLLPDIINNNNESIRNEFNWIYDSSLNRLTKSVYAPAGSVKTHFGEFINLSCEYLTIKNVDSLKNTILSAVESIVAESFDPSAYNHNLLSNRFIYNDFENSGFKHDAAGIVYKKDGETYTSVESTLNSLSEINNKMNSSVSALTTNAETTNSSVNSLTSRVSSLNSTVSNINRNLDDITIKVNDNILPSLNNLKYNRITDVEYRNAGSIAAVIPAMYNDIILSPNTLEERNINIGIVKEYMEILTKRNTNVNEIKIRIHCTDSTWITLVTENMSDSYAWINLDGNSLLVEPYDGVEFDSYDKFQLLADLDDNNITTIYEITIKYNNYLKADEGDESMYDPRYTMSFKRYNKLSINQ